MVQATPSFEQLLIKLLSELGAFDVASTGSSADAAYDYRVVGPDGKTTLLEVKTYQRITPANAESAFRAMKEQSENVGAEPVLFASVVSDRTAEIAREYGVSWVDFAGNCRLVFPEHSIYVRRSGIPNLFGKTMSGKLNVFSTKSSRVVRVLLQAPTRAWKLGELAEHSDVVVSNGLMSRIKKSLVDDGYAVMHDRRLCLTRPKSLLRDWVEHYRSEERTEYEFYVRDDLEAVETTIANWCARSEFEYALSRFSAAWRLTPEVRYSVATFLVSDKALRAAVLGKLREQCGAKRVDSGANLVLQVPDDESFFSARMSMPLQVTSPLQTYLDLMGMGGRGEEAAAAIYDQYLRGPIEQAEVDAKALV